MDTRKENRGREGELGKAIIIVAIYMSSGDADPRSGPSTVLNMSVVAMNAGLAPLDSALSAAEQQQRDTLDRLAVAHAGAAAIDNAVAQASRTFNKLPVYTEKLSRLASGIATLQGNARAVKELACRVGDDILLHNNTIGSPRHAELEAALEAARRASRVPSTSAGAAVT